MKFDRPFLLTIVYVLFTFLYTLYIVAHPGDFGHHKGGSWGYFLKFQLAGSYCFIIGQGALRKAANWGVLLLLPPAIIIATILSGFLLVWILRLGGGTLLDQDKADMILVTVIVPVLSFFALRRVRGEKSGPGRGRRASR